MLFFDYGVDIESKDKKGWIVFYFGIVVGYCDVVSLLINLCVDLICVDCKGCLLIDFVQIEDMLILIVKVMESVGYVEIVRLYFENWGLRILLLLFLLFYEDM